MDNAYEVTGQTMGVERQPDGTVMPVVTIKFTVNTTPPTQSEVSVPKSLLKDKTKYAETVKAAIENAVEAHQAVAAL